MFGLVISFQGNIIKMHYPEISSYLNEKENWRTCKNMKATYENLCDYGRDCETIYFTFYGLLQEHIESVMNVNSNVLQISFIK